MKKNLCILLLTIPFFMFGQGWENSYGSPGEEYGYSVQQTNDGGYIFTSGTYGGVWLVKTDGNGVQQWSHIFGYSGDDTGRDVKQTTDGGYIVLCQNLDTITNHFYLRLIKTDSIGDSLWVQSFNGIEGRSVQQTTDGGYVICGTIPDDTGSWNSLDVLLIKTDSNGNELWTKTFGTVSSPESFRGRSVQQTNDGGYIITGWYRDSFSSIFSSIYRNMLLIKTDPMGDSLWTKTFGPVPPKSSHGQSVQQTNDGGYIICGVINHDISALFPEKYKDIYLIKTNSQGDSLWTKIIGEYQSTDEGGWIEKTTDGGYIICGSSNINDTTSHLRDVWLVKTDSIGNIIWTKTFGGIHEDGGYKVKQTTDGGYIIIGTTFSFGAGFCDVYLIKTDGNGNVTSTFNIPIPSSSRKLEKVVDILGRETKPQKNIPFIEIYDDGSTEKKIVVE